MTTLTLMKNSLMTAASLACMAMTLGLSEAPAKALSVTQNNNGNDLLNSLLGSTSGLSNFSVTTTGLPNAFGLFSNDTVFGLGSGVVLSTGNAVDAVGPNDTGSKSGPGNLAQIDIKFDADNTVDKLFFQYVFGSEEFLEYAGSPFNDSFQLLLNGTNLALLGNGKPVTVNNLAASPIGPFDPAFVNNTGNETQLDGYTKALVFQGLLKKNASNSLSIKIADVGDSSYDSAVFIKGGSIAVVPPNAIPTPALLPGLIGLGLGVLRKRKAEAAASSEA